jgi:hypothetical protein
MSEHRAHSARERSVLTRSVRDWIALGHPGALASVGEDRRPEAARVWVVRTHAGADVLDIAIARSASRVMLRNLEQNPQAALNLAAPITYRSAQFKGPCAECFNPPDADYIEAWMASVDEQMQAVGLPPGSPARMLGNYGPGFDMAWLSMRVVSVYDQSPKPGAGSRL